MKKTISLLLAIFCLSSLTCCANESSVKEPEMSNVLMDDAFNVVTDILADTLTDFNPSVEYIVGNIVYWLGGGDLSDDFVVYYQSEGMLYSTLITIDDHTARNKGLVLTQNTQIERAVDDGVAFYISGEDVADNVNVNYCSYDEFESSMDYSFDDIRNALAQELAESMFQSNEEPTDKDTFELNYHTLRGYIGTWGDGRNCLYLNTTYEFYDTADNNQSKIDVVFFYPESWGYNGYNVYVFVK